MSKASRETSIKWEIERLRQADPRKRIKPEAVVEFAKTHPKSALHKEFEWDVGKAAMQTWLNRARDLIKVSVTMLPDARTGKPVVASPTFVSTPSERGHGYSEVTTILARADTRADMLRYCIERLQGVTQAWTFPELNEVTAAIDRVAAKFTKKRAA